MSSMAVIFSMNSENLPYPDPIHPILVHFVIATVLFSFLCDLIGRIAKKRHLFEVSFWNLFVAAVAIVPAVFFGQFEAGLSTPRGVAETTLDAHSVTGWSLSVLVVAVAVSRFVLRYRDPLRIPPAFLGVSAALACLVSFQTFLGTRLVWVYGLHVEPVVEAARLGG